MPIIKTKRKKSTCFKFGKSGKTYCGAGARNKAKKQGAAIEISKKRRGKK